MVCESCGNFGTFCSICSVWYCSATFCPAYSGNFHNHPPVNSEPFGGNWFDNFQQEPQTYSNSSQSTETGNFSSKPKRKHEDDGEEKSKRTKNYSGIFSRTGEYPQQNDFFESPEEINLDEDIPSPPENYPPSNYQPNNYPILPSIFTLFPGLQTDSNSSQQNTSTSGFQFDPSVSAFRPFSSNTDSTSNFQTFFRDTNNIAPPNFSASQSRRAQNTLQQSENPALGIVTWNMQRMGRFRGQSKGKKTRGQELDSKPVSIDKLYKKNKDFLNAILERIIVLEKEIEVYEYKLQLLETAEEDSDQEIAILLTILQHDKLRKKQILIQNAVIKNFFKKLKEEITSFTSAQDFKTHHWDTSEKDRGMLYLHLKKFIYLTTNPDVKKATKEAPRSVERGKLLESLALYRRQLKLEHIVEMFEKNQWLDVLIMQEIGLGFELLKNVVKHYAAKRGIQLECYSGPLTQSQTWDEKEKKLKKGYEEYFAIVVKKEVVVEKCGWSDTEGNIKEFDIGQGCKEIYNYIRAEDQYRPIVFYKLKPPPPRDTTSVYVGVVHTTPHGTEFKREKDYLQINESSLKLREYAKDQWVIIGGDYYLTAEATVKAIEEAKKEKFEKETELILNTLTLSRNAAFDLFEIAEKTRNQSQEKNEKVFQLLKECRLERQYVNDAQTTLLNLIHLKITDTAQAFEIISGLKVTKPDSMSEGMVKYALKLENNNKAYKELLEATIKIDINYLVKLKDLLEENSQSKSFETNFGNQSQISFNNEVYFLQSRIKHIESAIHKISDNSHKDSLVKDSQISELNRNSAEITFAAAVEKKNWVLCQATTATNWKNPPTSGSDDDWARGRIADFFICTKDWIMPQVGLIIPPFIMPGVMFADSADLLLSRHWIAISDHIPIAGYFTGVPGDNKFFNAMLHHPTEEKFLEHKKFHAKGYYEQLELEAADFNFELEKYKDEDEFVNLGNLKEENEEENNQEENTDGEGENYD